ncbi:MAG: DUF2946 family protein [Rhodospirillales bacterium]|nr:DUF2946 family protein [Rhodospirillales bacterium]MBN8907246.1 DUF2946 family protein [Rhodospirillales bacterium]
MPARLLLALLLVLAQGLGVRTAFPTATEALLADIPICHTDGGDAGSGQLPGKPTAPHGHDCALCPVCHHATAPMLLPARHAVPLPRLHPERRTATLLPPATGPPAASVRIPPPRAPPVVSA